MNALLGDSPLFRKITLSILLASVFFLSLLSVVVYYSNEILEDDLLARQTDFELSNIRELLARDPDAALPRSASLSIYLDSRHQVQPIPGYLRRLGDGVHHDIRVDGKAYHVMIEPTRGDRIYIQYDVTEIERSEALLEFIVLIAWIVLLLVTFVIARILSRKLSGPIAQLSEELSRIDPNQRGIRLGQRFEDDEVGRIARAFDSYTEKMDGYVEKQMAFAAMASHELRSPLTIVQTSADLIASRQHDPALEPQLEKIQRAAASMGNMIHALLAVTRDQPVHDADQTVPLRVAVDEIIATMAPETHAKQITVENRIAPGAGVEADPALLTVVITNLVRNAVKHGGNSSIEIDFQGALLTISDNGSGLDPEALQRIFDFAYRGRHSDGYGVGLYISRLVCDYSGWSLDLAPNDGGGVIASIDFEK